MESLLTRDFPNFNFEDKKQEEVLFTPPHYLHQRLDLPGSSTPEFQKVEDTLNPDTVANIRAEDFEKLVFDSFKTYLEAGQRNVAVIQGWKRNWTSLQFKKPPEKGKGDEHDLIIIDGNRKLVILFEVKSTVNQSTLEKATEQLKKQVEYIKKYHGHVLTSDWKITTIIPFKESRNIFECKNCCNFLLHLKENDSPHNLELIQKFWGFLGTMMADFKAENNDQESKCHAEGNQQGSEFQIEGNRRGAEFQAKNVYKSLIGRIIGCSSSHPLYISTEKKFRHEIKKALTCDENLISGSMPPAKKKEQTKRLTSDIKTPTENKKKYPITKDKIGDERVTFFLSPEQRSSMINKNNLRMDFTGKPGTGKSLLLKVKALKLSEELKKVAFVIGRPKDSVSDKDIFAKNFYDLTIRDFRGTNVEVFFARDKSTDFFFKKYQEGFNIFWDEAHYNIKTEIEEFLVSQKAPNNNQYFWIVTAKDLRNGGGVSDGRNTDQEKLFLPLETNFCFRNSIDILNFIDFFEEVIMNQAPFFSDEKQVGNLPSVILYKTDLQTALARALKNYTGDSVLVFNQDNLDLTFAEKEGWNVIKWQDYLEIKAQTANTIIVGESFESLTGIEVKNLIFFSKEMDDQVTKGFSQDNCDMNLIFAVKLIMLRAVSHLTVILKDFSAEPVQPPDHLIVAHNSFQHNRQMKFLKKRLENKMGLAISGLESNSKLTRVD